MILLSKHTLKLVKLITRTKAYSEYFFNFKSSFGKALIFEGNIFTLIFLLNVHNSIRITCRLSEKNSINHWSTITKRYLLHPNTSHYNLLYLLSIYTIATTRYYENENVEFDEKKGNIFLQQPFLSQRIQADRVRLEFTRVVHGRTIERGKEVGGKCKFRWKNRSLMNSLSRPGEVSLSPSRGLHS